MSMPEYDDQNVFAKILRGEIPSDNKIYENEHMIGLTNIDPRAKVHIVVISKGAYVSMRDFSARATDAEKLALYDAVNDITRDLGLDVTGYRLVNNTGSDSRGTVPHLHLHIMGGEPLADVTG